ncbi:CLUMA_CG004147, isoform A [Clunio marinus]|uniref:CLUMA_CG004147, isoform A n=1 Tax=Clunio marinus TaxID=568069 RepID=A0A1J1HQV1_9DIPT|nr:CLUMA_CG004147, isoform A [Clunio marinus]
MSSRKEAHHKKSTQIAHLNLKNSTPNSLLLISCINMYETIIIKDSKNAIEYLSYRNFKKTNIILDIRIVATSVGGWNKYIQIFYESKQSFDNFSHKRTQFVILEPELLKSANKIEYNIQLMEKTNQNKHFIVTYTLDANILSKICLNMHCKVKYRRSLPGPNFYGLFFEEAPKSHNKLMLTLIFYSMKMKLSWEININAKETKIQLNFNFFLAKIKVKN